VANRSDSAKPRITTSRDGAGPAVVVSRNVPGGGEISTHVWIAPETDAIDVRVFGGWKGTLKPDAGMNAALQAGFECEPAPARILADAPYSIDVVRGSGECRRKYPSGDWMTSPQWFESVTDPFTSSSLVDMGNDRGGALVVHDGSQQWFRRERGARVVLTAYDPWDEGRYTGSNFSAGFRIIPHRGMTHADRAGRAAEYNAATAPDRFNRDSQPVGGGTAGDRDKRDIPSSSAAWRFAAHRTCWLTLSSARA
jgi:alpha-mannosidase